MQPYYEDASTVLWQGDARALPIPDASVHLVVTSPPYNARIAYDGYEDWLPWDEYWHGLIEPSLRECYRVLVHGGRIAVNIGNVMRVDGKWARFMLPELMRVLESAGFLPREHITWLKAGSPENQTNTSTAWGSWCSARNPVVRALAEPIVVMSKGTYEREPGDSDLTKAEFLEWTRNVWSLATDGAHSKHTHPAAFPVALARRLIKLYSYVGDTVLDPFAGSGTTLRAAKNERRRGVGVELSPKYCAGIAGRLAQDLLPLEALPMS